jgi:hypothetical protein
MTTLYLAALSLAFGVFLGSFAMTLIRPAPARGRHRPTGGRHRRPPAAPRPAGTLYSPAGRGYRP